MENKNLTKIHTESPSATSEIAGLRCYACNQPVIGQCSQCGQFYCERHGQKRITLAPYESWEPRVRVTRIGICASCASWITNRNSNIFGGLTGLLVVLVFGVWFFEDYGPWRDFRFKNAFGSLAILAVGVTTWILIRWVASMWGILATTILCVTIFGALWTKPLDGKAAFLIFGGGLFAFLMWWRRKN